MSSLTLCFKLEDNVLAIERDVISSYQIVQSLGFNRDFRAWERVKKERSGEML
jgi:hypothetical protein